MKRIVSALVSIILYASLNAGPGGREEGPSQNFGTFVWERASAIPCNQANHVWLLSPVSSQVFGKKRTNRQQVFANYYIQPLDWKKLNEGQYAVYADIAWTHVGYHFADTAIGEAFDRVGKVHFVRDVTRCIDPKDREFFRDNVQVLVAAGGIEVMRTVLNGQELTSEHGKNLAHSGSVHLVSEAGKHYIVNPLVKKTAPDSEVGQMLGKLVGDAIVAKIALEVIAAVANNLT